MVKLVLPFLDSLLDKFTKRMSCMRPRGEQDRVVLGGHYLILFNEQGQSSWASASAELLASCVALVAFGCLVPHPQRFFQSQFLQGVTIGRTSFSRVSDQRLPGH